MRTPTSFPAENPVDPPVGSGARSSVDVSPRRPRLVPVALACVAALTSFGLTGCGGEAKKEPAAETAYPNPLSTLTDAEREQATTDNTTLVNASVFVSSYLDSLAIAGNRLPASLPRARAGLRSGVELDKGVKLTSWQRLPDGYAMCLAIGDHWLAYDSTRGGVIGTFLEAGQAKNCADALAAADDN